VFERCEATRKKWSGVSSKGIFYSLRAFPKSISNRKDICIQTASFLSWDADSNQPLLRGLNAAFHQIHLQEGVTMEKFEIVKRAQIDGDFHGFGEGALFKLTDGSCWIQDESKSWYHYAICPVAKILRKDGRCYIQVDAQDEIAPVRQASNVIKSKIKGEFKGWNGKTSYALVNGQVWEQASQKFRYKYAYMPNVVIYETPSGMMMDVAGTRAKVRRVEPPTE
jgi:hypothetical protein